MTTKLYRYRCRWCNQEFKAINRTDAERKALSHYVAEHTQCLYNLVMYDYINKYLIEKVEEKQ
jgi:predicted SprT family Zn-dependent metalloprotease